MTQRQLTCIGCPMGCQLIATLENGVVTSVTGNTCKRGDSYARKECVAPARTVTGTVRCTGGTAPVVSVRTAGEVPKAKVFDVAHALNTALVTLPVAARWRRLISSRSSPTWTISFWTARTYRRLTR